MSVLASLLIVMASACATTNPNSDYSKEPDPRAQEFPIGPGDRLQVNVWRDAELTTDARVRPDGAITVPLVGDVRAAGRTASQIRDEIQSKLTAFMNSDTAKLTVHVTEVHSYYFTVSGNAERPGIYRPTTYVTVLEAMTIAGEPNRYAQADRVQILRRDPAGGLKKIPVNYDLLRRGERMDQNIVILPGDNIVIP
ncbi:MAG TPA: polysaccharide biosynthesis/export family protein [Polyangia bacterium]